MVENVKLEIVNYPDDSSEDSETNNLLVVRKRVSSKKPRAKPKATPMEQQSKQPIFCSLCHASFGRQDHLKRHMECLHSNYNLLKCPKCTTQCTSTKALKNHVIQFHSCVKTTFECRLCQTVLDSFKEFTNHEALHLANRHQCPECSTMFKRRDHMLRHVRAQHLHEREYCSVCGLEFKRRDHLVRHAREKHCMAVPLKSKEPCDGS